jgi:selenium-dependent xanthine dehydrogenase
VVTVDGLAEAHDMASALVAAGAVQCGFCIPGILVRAHALLSQQPSLSVENVRRALDNHICRCTGYATIVEGIVAYSQGWRPEYSRCQAERYRGVELALGLEPFMDDIAVAGCLFAAVRFSDHPRARVTAINTTRAMDVAGVVRVVTADNVPGERRIGLLRNDWPVFVGIGEETRYVGDVIAAVVAETETAARAAALLVEITYEVLTPVTAPAEALGVSAFHPAAAIHSSSAIVSSTVISTGELDSAVRGATFRVSEAFTTQAVEQAFLEPESAIAMVEDDGGVRVLSQNQGVFDDRRQIARVLGVGVDKVRVDLVPTGGAFGGKEDLSIQAHTALLALLTGRPVRLRLSRADSIRLHPKRHPFELHYELFADARGVLLGLRALVVGDSGAYASVSEKVLERAATHAAGVYRVPNLEVRAVAIQTNNPPAGAMRGFGVPQVTFAMEGMMDRLAAASGLDLWEVRARNVLRPGDSWSTGQPIADCQGITDTLNAVRETYYSHPRAGLACGMKNVGLGNGVLERAIVELVVHPDSIEVITGFSEMGQGLFTALCRLASRTTDLPLSLFSVRCNTTSAVDSGMTTASRATFLAGRAIISAAETLKGHLDGGKTLRDLSGCRFVGRYDASGTTLEAGSERPNHFAFAFAAQVAILDNGGAVSDIVAAHDVGTVINPSLLRSQLEGSIHMGLGFALTEEISYRSCVPATFQLRRLGVIRARYMPRIELIYASNPAPEGPAGARGAGEIGMVPTAAAVASAVSQFEKCPRRSLPLRGSAATTYAQGHGT